MNNQTYVQSLNIDAEAEQKCLEAMAKYAENKWWEADVDPRTFAYYQLNEPIMLSDFSLFHESLELLLGRPVFTHELAINYDGLGQEAQRAWQWGVGVTSDKERAERVSESIASLHTWAKEHGKEVIEVEIPEREVK